MWSNKAPRKKFIAEKSHSLSFSVRVEDRLHQNIIQPTDACWFTVRPVDYTLGVTDDDLVPGTGVKAVAVIDGTGEATVFRFDIQASSLNLRPDVEYWYDLTYVRGGYSVSIGAGPFEVAANVTNRGAGQVYTNGSTVSFVAQVGAGNQVNVTVGIPMPAKGDRGAALFVCPLVHTATWPATGLVVPGASWSTPLSSLPFSGGDIPRQGDTVLTYASTTNGTRRWLLTCGVTGTAGANVNLQTLTALLVKEP